MSAVLYNETSHILSYIFFKTLLVFNVNKVIKSNIFNFKLTTLDLIELDIKMSRANPIDDLFIILKNYSLNNDVHTIINTSYTIYKKYIALLKPLKKITFKKVPLLKLYTKKLAHNISNQNNFLLTNLNFMFIDYAI